MANLDNRCNQVLILLTVESPQWFHHATVLQGFVSMSKSVINIRRDIPDAYAETADPYRPDLLAELKESAVQLLTAYREGLEGGDLTLGNQLLDEGTAEVSILTSMSKLQESFLWLRNTDSQYDLASDLGCEHIDTMLSEVGAVIAGTPDIPGGNSLSTIVTTLETVRDTVCGVAHTSDCYDINAIKSIAALQDSALIIQSLSDENNADAFMVASLVWRLGITRIVQAQINQALSAANAWSAVGGLHDDYDVNDPAYGMVPIEGAWTSAADAFETDLSTDSTSKLNTFISAFTATGAKCMAHYVFEAVNAWWDDAGDSACTTPYAMPAACNSGTWPLHGTKETYVE